MPSAALCASAPALSPCLKPPETALILIADDNPTILSVLQATLTAQAYQVALAEDGEAALAQTWQLHPAVVMMDIQMDKLDEAG